MVAYVLVHLPSHTTYLGGIYTILLGVTVRVEILALGGTLLGCLGITLCLQSSNAARGMDGGNL